jgi:hypothetical protein
MASPLVAVDENLSARDREDIGRGQREKVRARIVIVPLVERSRERGL